MIKFLFVARRAPGTTREAAQAHLRDVHGRMVVLPPVDAGPMPAYYAQNHVLDGAYLDSEGVLSIERDLITELQFESIEAMRAAVATPYYLEHLRPDEPRFVDDATVMKLPVQPRPIVAGSRTAHKLFAFVSRAEATPDDAWAAACAALAATISGLSGLSALVGNVAGGAANAVAPGDIVYEAWFNDRDTAKDAARSMALIASTGGDAVCRILILAEEFTQERLRSLLR